MSEMKKLLEAVDKLNEGLNWNFAPPFRSNGLWVNDSRGVSVCECTRTESAKVLAGILTAHFKRI